MAFCTQCGESVGHDAAFCTNCGATRLPIAPADQTEEPSAPGRDGDAGISDPEPAAEPENPTCASCGSPIVPGTAFCTQCGTAAPATLDPEQTDGPEPQPTPEADADPVESGPPVADPRLEEPAQACASCGADIGSDATFCVSCGRPVVAAGAGAAAAAETTLEPEIVGGTEDQGAETSPNDEETVEQPESETILAAAATTYTIPATEHAACENCGTPLESGALFCVTCGTKTGGPPAPTQQLEIDQPETGKRSRLLLIAAIVAIVIAMIAAGAWFGWKQLSNNGDEPDETTLSSSTTAAEQESGDTQTAATSTPTTVVHEALCWDLGVRAVDATSSLAAAFETASFDELVSMARIGRSALPGAAVFDTEWASINTEATESGCETASIETTYATELGSRTPPTGAQASLVWSAARSLQDTGADPLTQVDSALRVYPIHNPITPAAAPPEAGLPKWVVMLASLNTGDSSRSDAQARADEYTAMGLPAEILLTDVYGSLTPGYWAVFTGPFPDRDEAREYARSIKSIVPDAYQRYIQVLPSTDPPFGQCGPYGMIDISGVDADKSVPVLSRPEDGRAEIVQLPGTTTGVLVAGPAETSGGSWTPLAVNGAIGWIKTQYTTDNASCPRTDPLVSGVSCAQIATVTVDLFKEISDAAAGASEAGTVASITAGQFDSAAASLADQASATGCSAAELNTLLAVDKSRIAPPNAFAELTVQTLYTAPFFRDG